MKYLLALLIPVVAHSQTTFYSNQYGQSVGSSYVVGNTTYYSNQYGQPVGSSVTPNVPSNNPTPSVPPTVLDRSVSNGYTPVPVLPQLPILPMLPMLGATK